MSAVVDVRDLAAGYGSTPVLAALDLCVESGEVVAVVGPNGTGKTTLLRTLCSLHQASASRAMIAGHRLGSASGRAAASFAGDEPVFFTDISLVEQLEYLAALGRASEPVAHVERIITTLGLEERRDQLPQTMSRGWRQRAALACALARAAPLLCIDEPFVGLDTAGREQLVDALAWYRTLDRAAVIVATHDPDGLAGLAPRIFRLASD